MSDVITGVRQAIQDLLAPELKSQAVKLDSLQKQFDALQKQLEETRSGLQKQIEASQAGLQKQIEASQAGLQKQIEANQASLQKQSELQHDAVIKTLEGFRAEMRSEIAVLRANTQVEVYRQVTPVSERLAIVESRSKQG